MEENEEMSVLEQDQGDGWTRVRKKDETEGFVPTSYIQIHFFDQDEVWSFSWLQISKRGDNHEGLQEKIDSLF